MLDRKDIEVLQEMFARSENAIFMGLIAYEMKRIDGSINWSITWNC